MHKNKIFFTNDRVSDIQLIKFESQNNEGILTAILANKPGQSIDIITTQTERSCDVTFPTLNR